MSRARASWGPRLLIPAAIACIAYLIQRDTATTPLVGAILWAIPGVMLILAIHWLSIWRFLKVQLVIGVLVCVCWFWWEGSPHADLRVVKADQAVQWRDDGSAQLVWTVQIENQRYGTSVREYQGWKLITLPENVTTATPQQIADAIASLERASEHREDDEARDSSAMAPGARKDFAFRVGPLGVNQLTSWRAGDRTEVVYLLRLEYADWHGFYTHVRYLCRIGTVSSEEKRPCPGLNDL